MCDVSYENYGQFLLDVPGARPDPTGEHRVVIDGIKVEIQATQPIAPRDLEGLTDKQMLYVGAHRYALESATPVTLVAEAEQGRATVLLATPAACSTSITPEPSETSWRRFHCHCGKSSATPPSGSSSNEPRAP